MNLKFSLIFLPTDIRANLNNVIHRYYIINLTRTYTTQNTFINTHKINCLTFTYLRGLRMLTVGPFGSVKIMDGDVVII